MQRERLAEQFRGGLQFVQGMTTINTRDQVVSHLNSIAGIQLFVDPGLQISVRKMVHSASS